MTGEAPSNRSFGWVFTTFFALLGAYLLWRGSALHALLLALAGITALVTLSAPRWLGPLNRAWMRFGDLLHRVVSPLVLGLIFYGVFTPVALVMRLAGRDALQRRFAPLAPTYWVERDPPGPPPGSFQDQF